jgi:hypothetical protein
MGGLGNQLFQVASVWGYSTKNNATFVMDKRLVSSNCFKHSDKFYTDIYNRFITKQKINWNAAFNEPPQTAYVNLPPYSGDKNIVFMGYFQSPKYFQHISGDILQWLLPEPAKIYTAYPDISNTAFIHIRMGDYIQVPLHNVNLHSYYKKAIEKLPAGTRLIAITNNEAEARKHYPEIVEQTQGFLQENDPLQTIRIMACAGHGIICANSSFSWWGAYLNHLHTGKISYAPSKWFNDPTYKWDDIFYNGLEKIAV